MDVRTVDTSATSGTTLLHRSHPAIKLVAFGLVLSAIVVSVNLLVVVGVMFCLLGVIAALRLPARPMLALAAYPGLFAALFAFAAAADYLNGALVVAKAVTAGLAAVLLMFTTPYPQVFAPLQRFLPVVIGDALLMTYRSLFLLLEKFGHVLTAARLRAGLATAAPVQNARTATRALGAVLLYSVDLSQRTYDVMHLRGYDGRLVVTAHASASTAAQFGVVVGAAAVALVAALWRLGGQVAAAYAWLPLLGGLACLAIGLIVRIVRSEEAR